MNNDNEVSLWINHFQPIDILEGEILWFPDKKEQLMVESAVNTENFILAIINRFGKEECRELFQRLKNSSVYLWFVYNFGKEKYTNDGKNEVTEEMVQRAISEYIETEIPNKLYYIKHGI